MKEFGSLEGLLKNIDKVKGESKKKAPKENEKLGIKGAVLEGESLGAKQVEQLGDDALAR